MKAKKIVWITVMIITGAAILDAIRYLQPVAENKIQVQPQQANLINSADTIVFVYNANGGIYPGLVDVVRKEFFPKTYPCNLCYHAFGTFGKKQEWKHFLADIKLNKKELHKDTFIRKYQYSESLPVILIASDNTTKVLVTAEEINQVTSLQQLIDLTQKHLQQYTSLK